MFRPGTAGIRRSAGSVAMGWRTAVGVMAACAVGAPMAPGQCGGDWLAGQGVPGLYGTVNSAMAWDPDGAGPEPTKLVIGGSMVTVGDVASPNVAVWDGVSWSALGTSPPPNN